MHGAQEEKNMSAISMVKKLIPKPMKPPLIKLYQKLNFKSAAKKVRNSLYIIKDNIEVWRGKRDRLTPPERMIFVGLGDFKAIGNEFFNYFTQKAQLQPTANILEVGCGIGRMAVPLMGYLKDGGSYDGFDIVKEGIRWCQKNISPRCPNFRFQLTDIYNSAYNPCGKYSASEYVFPYEPETFDFVFLTSVFTHMMQKDMEHYLKEITRVLRKGGKCFITYFLLNRESLDLVDSGAGRMNFKYALGENRIIDNEIPDSAIAFPEKNIRDLYAANRLEIIEPVYYGDWCGRKNFLSFQDIVIAVKKN
jgi:SAM-dependent methyltransferase